MKLPKDKKVYVIGMSGLEEELRDEGISILGGTVGSLTPFGPVADKVVTPHQTAGPGGQRPRELQPGRLDA